MTEKKIYLQANDLLQMSYQLAVKIIKDDFIPDFIVAIWRGGTPIGIAVQELMAFQGIKTDHIAIRTSSYTKLKRGKEVRVHNLGYLIGNINADNRLLIIDDVFDTGKSIEAVLESIETQARRNTPREIKIAAPYFKPGKNLTKRTPDYYCEITEDWLVFPHELCGLEESEIIANRPEMKQIFNALKV